MEAFRRVMRGWTMRILLSVLALSFVLWGIPADFLGLGQRSVVKIGSSSISPQEYSVLFGDELRALQNEAGRSFTVEEARRFGLDQRVFAKLKIDEHARQLGIGYSDQAIVDRLAQAPGFRKPDGSLDKDALKLRLQQSQLSEQQFFASERRSTVRAQMVEAINSAPPVPQILLETINRFQAEQRMIDYFIIPDSKAPAPATADEAKLKAFYEERKADFMAPEYRKLALLLADPQKLKGAITVTADDIKAAYEATKASFATPETRNIQQIIFPDMGAAQKAYAELQAGKDFVEVAKAAGKTEADINRGVIRKEDLLDKKAAEAAFSFGAQTFTVPVEGDLAISILRARDIKPATQKTLEEVKAQVEDTLKLEGAQKQLLELGLQIDEKRASAMALNDIAKEMKLEFREIAAVDKTGKDKEGKDLGLMSQVLTVGFSKEVGVETETINLGTSGYAWADVLAVEPTRQKTYDEVKDAVAKAWTESEKAKALSELGRTLVTKINAGEDIKKLAADAQLTVKTSAPFTRRNPGDIPVSAAKLAFALAKDGGGTVASDDGKGRVVLKLREITAPPTLDADKKVQLGKQLQELANDDMQAQYLQALDGQLGFSIDASGFEQMTGLPGFGS